MDVFPSIGKSEKAESIKTGSNEDLTGEEFAPTSRIQIRIDPSERIP
jgi:hypothetical protein